MEGEWSCYRICGEWRENSHVTEVARLKEGAWSCCHFNGRENGHVTEVVTLMEGEWSYYSGGQFLWEGEWSCYSGGQFNGGRMVMLV